MAAFTAADAPLVITGRDGKAYVKPRTEGDSVFWREQYSGLPLQSVKPVSAVPETETFLPVLAALVVLLWWRWALRSFRGRA